MSVHLRAACPSSSSSFERYDSRASALCDATPYAVVPSGFAQSIACARVASNSTTSSHVLITPPRRGSMTQLR